MNGWLVPHAPLLLPGVNETAETRALERIRARLPSIESGRALVLVTPHGPRPGVFARSVGSLSAFGLSHRVEAETGPAAALADAWGAELLADELDHGAVVPLLLMAPPGPVTCVSLPGPDRAAGTALREVFGDDLTLIASANGSAGLTPRAPLTEIPEARAAHERFVDAIGRDAALMRETAEALPGSCAAGPVGVLADLFEGTAGEVLADEAPVGVGYTIAAFAR